MEGFDGERTGDAKLYKVKMERSFLLRGEKFPFFSRLCSVGSILERTGWHIGKYFSVNLFLI